MDQYQTMNKYLISGGSGYLGRALIKHLSDLGELNILVVARNEGKLVALKEEFPHIEILPGSISDPFVCEKACKDVNGIFHLAAFKHITLAQENVRECVDSNVLGTINLLEQTRKVKPDFIIGISTDKAAKVTGVYGATKHLQEALFSEYERVNKFTKYRTVRYGNVLYSTGSVLCKWKDRLTKGQKVIVTDMDSTRFYWTVDEAVALIFSCLKEAKDSKPFVTSMKSIRTGDLLEAMIEKYAVGTPQIEIIGLQGGENMHEVITEDGKDSSMAQRYTKEEILSII